MARIRLALARPIYLGCAAAFAVAWGVAALAPQDSGVTHAARLVVWPLLIALIVVFLLEPPSGHESRRNGPSAS